MENKLFVEDILYYDLMEESSSPFDCSFTFKEKGESFISFFSVEESLPGDFWIPRTSAFFC